MSRNVFDKMIDGKLLCRAVFCLEVVQKSGIVTENRVIPKSERELGNLEELFKKTQNSIILKRAFICLFYCKNFKLISKLINTSFKFSIVSACNQTVYSGIELKRWILLVDFCLFFCLLSSIFYLVWSFRNLCISCT